MRTLVLAGGFLLLAGCSQGRRIDTYTDQQGIAHRVETDVNDPAAIARFLYDTGVEGEVSGNWGTGHLLGWAYNFTGSTGGFKFVLHPRKPESTGGAP